MCAKTILCYGDSDTWGYDPAAQGRFPRYVRWSGVLRNELGEGYLIIEEGLNGRTTVWDDPIKEYKNGKEYLRPCLETRRPIDLVVIPLCTNDLKVRFPVSAFDTAGGGGGLVDVVQKSIAGLGDRAPQVLLLASSPVARLSECADMFEGAEPKSRRFAAHCRGVHGNAAVLFSISHKTAREKRWTREPGWKQPLTCNCPTVHPSWAGGWRRQNTFSL